MNYDFKEHKIRKIIVPNSLGIDIRNPRNHVEITDFYIFENKLLSLIRIIFTFINKRKLIIFEIN